MFPIRAGWYSLAATAPKKPRWSNWFRESLRGYIHKTSRFKAVGNGLGDLLMQGSLIAGSAAWALQDMPYPAYRNYRYDEEDRDELHSFLHNERHHNAAFSAVHRIIGGGGSPYKKAGPYNEHSLLPRLGVTE
jgi:hypothetical protein